MIFHAHVAITHNSESEQFLIRIATNCVYLRAIDTDEDAVYRTIGQGTADTCDVTDHAILLLTSPMLLAYVGEMPLQDVLTPRRVHLLGGVSDAGKTRFILPALLSWTSAPPWVYVAGDRTLDDAQDSMRDMGIAPATVPMVPAFGEHNKASWLEVKLAVDRAYPQAELIVVEGFQDLVPGQGRKTDVREFLSAVSAYLNPSPQHPNGLTILGVVESPKLKPHEQYSNPRQRVSGPSGWGYHASTILLIESAARDEQFLTGNRIMWVCHKGQQRRKINGCFDNANRLVFPSL